MEEVAIIGIDLAKRSFQGRARVGQLAGALEDGDQSLREAVASARECEETGRLMTIPGIWPVTEMALQTFAPLMEGFRRGRNFSAWLGLVPRQRTTGGKPKKVVAVGLANRTTRMVWPCPPNAPAREGPRDEAPAETQGPPRYDRSAPSAVRAPKCQILRRPLTPYPQRPGSPSAGGFRNSEPVGGKNIAVAPPGEPGGATCTVTTLRERAGLK